MRVLAVHQAMIGPRLVVAAIRESRVWVVRVVLRAKPSG
jgi:hypothetical protein